MRYFNVLFLLRASTQLAHSHITPKIKPMLNISNSETSFIARAACTLSLHYQIVHMWREILLFFEEFIQLRFNAWYHSGKIWIEKPKTLTFLEKLNPPQKRSLLLPWDQDVPTNHNQHKTNEPWPSSSRIPWYSVASQPTLGKLSCCNQGMRWRGDCPPSSFSPAQGQLTVESFSTALCKPKFVGNGLNNQPALLWRLIETLFRWNAVDDTTREGVSVFVMRWQMAGNAMRAGLPKGSRWWQCWCTGRGQRSRWTCCCAGGGWWTTRRGQVAVLLLHRWQAADDKRKAGSGDVVACSANNARRADWGNVIAWVADNATREGGGWWH